MPNGQPISQITAAEINAVFGPGPNRGRMATYSQIARKPTIRLQTLNDPLYGEWGQIVGFE